jgi:hypothetical protein
MSQFKQSRQVETLFQVTRARYSGLSILCASYLRVLPSTLFLSSVIDVVEDRPERAPPFLSYRNFPKLNEFLHEKMA